MMRLLSLRDSPARSGYLRVSDSGAREPLGGLGWLGIRRWQSAVDGIRLIDADRWHIAIFGSAGGWMMMVMPGFAAG
jgi:hypothetical protein